MKRPELEAVRQAVTRLDCGVTYGELRDAVGGRDRVIRRFTKAGAVDLDALEDVVANLWWERIGRGEPWSPPAN